MNRLDGVELALLFTLQKVSGKVCKIKMFDEILKNLSMHEANDY